MFVERVWNLKGWCAFNGELGKKSAKYSAQVYEIIYIDSSFYAYDMLTSVGIVTSSMCLFSVVLWIAWYFTFICSAGYIYWCLILCLRYANHYWKFGKLHELIFDCALNRVILRFCLVLAWKTGCYAVCIAYILSRWNVWLSAHSKCIIHYQMSKF